MKALESRPDRRAPRFYKVIVEDDVSFVEAENWTEERIVMSAGRKMGGGPSGAPLEAIPMGGFSGWRIPDKKVLAKLEKNLGKRGTFRDKPIDPEPPARY